MFKVHTCKWRGTGGETWRKGGGGVQEAGEEGTGSGFLKVTGGKKLCNIVQYFTIGKKAKRWEPINTGTRTGIKGYRKWEV